MATHPGSERLRQALLAMMKEDQSVREALAADGALFEGYHPRMEAVHRRNAARLEAILDEQGWPGRSLVGEDGAEAAWLVAQHAIGRPALQRRALRLLRAAAERGEVPAWQAALLEDRICLFEGRPQRYGTQFDWDDDGTMSPWPPVEDPEHVDERRAAVGLGPLEEAVRRHRAAAARSERRPPQDLEARRRAMDAWARSAGWRP